MTKPAAAKEYARYWRSPLLRDSDFLTARYVDHAFAPHWHDTFTIAAIEAGAERYQYRGAEQIAPMGTLGVINPGEVHTGSRAADEGWHYRVFYPSIAYIEELSRQISGRRGPLAFDRSVIADSELVQRLGAAHRLLESEADDLLAETALLQGMGLLLQRHLKVAPRRKSEGEDDPRVAAMKEILASDASSTISLSELATSVGLSAWHAMRLFARATGLPPYAWRTQLRINRSMVLLRQGLSVAQVAADTGFTDQSHFSRHFRRTVGVPPGRWQASTRR